MFVCVENIEREIVSVTFVCAWVNEWIQNICCFKTTKLLYLYVAIFKVSLF